MTSAYNFKTKTHFRLTPSVPSAMDVDTRVFDLTKLLTNLGIARPLMAEKISSEFFIACKMIIIDNTVHKEEIQTLNEDLIVFKSMTPNYQYMQSSEAYIQIC